MIELVRAQETELAQALKWQMLNAEENYHPMTVEARRATGKALRVTSESFSIATIASDAARRCRRALLEEWVGRETASFRLPPSRLALDPGDVLRFDHDGRLTSLRLTTTSDAGARLVEAARTDAAAYGLGPGPEREPRSPKPVLYGPPTVAFLNLPQLRESVPAHQPLVAAYTIPCPGRLAVWKSPGEDGFELVTTLGRPARIERFVTDLYPGPVSRLDLGNVATVDLAFGTLASVTDLALFAGANTLTVETSPGVLGGAAVRRRRADRTGALSALAAAARPARHIGRPGRAGAGGRPGRRARRDAGTAPGPGDGARARGQLALRTGLEAGLRPVLPRAEFHACGCRPAAVLGRSCQAAVAHRAHTRRSCDPVGPPLEGAGCRQLDRAGSAVGRGERGL